MNGVYTMILQELTVYDKITIQCHDNPDADAIASGFALYTYFKEQRKCVRFLYSGCMEIQKSNLVLFVENLQIPIEHMTNVSQKIEGLLITVDCQYGAGNVTKLLADEVAIIDHHQVEITNVALCEIRPNIGSCATLVWRLMKKAGFDFEGKMMHSPCHVPPRSSSSTY